MPASLSATRLNCSATVDIGLMRGKLFISTAGSCPPWVGIRCQIIKESERRLGGAQGLTVSGKYCGRQAGVRAGMDNILKIVVSQSVLRARRERVGGLAHCGQ